MRVLVPYLIADNMLTASNVPEADQPEWVAGGTYAAGFTAMRAATHRLYLRLTAGGGDVPPEADPSNWKDIGPTNRWAAFDGAIGTKTAQAGSVSFTLAIPGPVGDVVLLGVAGSSASITGPGVSRSASVSGGGEDGAVVQFTGLNGSAGSYTITVSGGSCAVGTCSVGTYTYIGDALERLQLGMADKSRKTWDAFGRPSLTKRRFQRRQTYPIAFDTAQYSAVAGALTALRSQAAVWEGVPGLGVSVVYGMPRRWSLRYSVGLTSSGSVTIEGLAQGVV